MRAAASEARPVGLPEHIADRAITRREQDRFDHEDFVVRLAAIVGATETPANIALFGRWGSGKSGVANRLEEQLAGVEDVEFARFDSFKFARLPLLRRFLVQLARSLGGEELAAEYGERIYQRKETAEMPPLSEAAKERIWRFAKAILIGLVASVYAFDLALIFFNPAERDGAVDLVGALLPVLIPSALLVALTAFGARYLTATTTTESPSSEEQFEALFAELLKRKRIGSEAEQRKLCVFVDELDRCSAEEVCETLDSIKTFLDVPGCVFIVAADQKVLEHALTERVRQATPVDLTNPYYSAGSAYLDKIFQYQLNLPPLLPGRLTGYASELLEEVSGVWDEVPNKDDVVSVLLPISVRSPRRVKVLLNSFAQTYALALSREASGRLRDANVRGRADEVAKLVGLQTEFPLFAADLAAHRKLPELVLAFTEEDPNLATLISGVPKDTEQRARDYAEGKLPTDAALHRREEADEAMQQAQRIDLIDYLRQTAQVAGPMSDLVHLESLHRVSGLDGALASELEDLALRNRPDLLVSLLEGTAPAERERAIIRLRELVRESRGNDIDNALRALLTAFPTAGAAISSVAKDLLGAVIRYDRERGLDAERLPGALELAILGQSVSLQRRILARPEALSEPLRAAALERTGALLDHHPTRLGEIMAAEVVEAPEKAAQRLLE